jgi:hypothetical protein
LANRGGEQVKSQLGSQKHRASQRMVPVQSALRETAHQLRSQGQGPIAQYADRASDQVERFSGYLRETDVDEIIDEVRGVARRRPALFLGAAATLGFFATRFLKSSSQQAGSAGTAVPAGPPSRPAGPPPRCLAELRSRRRPSRRGPWRESSDDGGTATVAGQPLSERERNEPPRNL